MYIIGRVILGTYLPMEDDETLRSIAEALGEEGLSSDETAKWLSEQEGWQGLYHGGISNSQAVGFFGIELAKFNDTQEFPWTELANAVNTELCDSGIIAAAVAAYGKIPSVIQDILPPFGVHVIWSSS